MQDDWLAVRTRGPQFALSPERVDLVRVDVLGGEPFLIADRRLVLTQVLHVELIFQCTGRRLVRGLVGLLNFTRRWIIDVTFAKRRRGLLRRIGARDVPVLVGDVSLADRGFCLRTVG